MPGKTTIEWATRSWNPVTGCTKVSPGCDHCYAETFAERWRGVPGHPYEQGFDLRLWPGRLEVPLHWPKPERIFVNSMSDLYHARIPFEFVERVWDVMLRAHWHTFLILTKRPDRMARFSERLPLLPNVWLGTSAEDQLRFDQRLVSLMRTKAVVRFLSCEPLLGPIDLGLQTLRAEDAELYTRAEYVRWVIVGGESGPHARPMDPDWARSIRDQCQTADVAFFLKQLGGRQNKRGHEKALLDGRRWLEFPSRPQPINPKGGGPLFSEPSDVNVAMAAPANLGRGSGAVASARKE